jgi:hypothetical protein
MDDRCNPSRVDELAAFQTDQDMEALCPGASESVRKLIGNSQVKLTFHLDLPAPRPEISFDELESSQMRHLTPPKSVSRSEPQTGLPAGLRASLSVVNASAPRSDASP